MGIPISCRCNGAVSGTSTLKDRLAPRSGESQLHHPGSENRTRQTGRRADARQHFPVGTEEAGTDHGAANPLRFTQRIGRTTGVLVLISLTIVAFLPAVRRTAKAEATA